jgi:hypothetical protein
MPTREYAIVCSHHPELVQLLPCIFWSKCTDDESGEEG